MMPPPPEVQKVAIVTGASQGIGECFAAAFLRAVRAVIATSVDLPLAERDFPRRTGLAARPWAGPHPGSHVPASEGQSSLNSRARATASWRVPTSSLRKMLFTWVLTVLNET